MQRKRADAVGSRPFWLHRLPLSLPGRCAAHLAGLPEGPDHEQILSMFANTAFWTLVGIVAVIVAV